jgi:hypothetical protein
MKPITIMHVTSHAGTPEENTRTHVIEHNPAPEVYHSTLECDLCGHEDYCVRVYGRPGSRTDICSACVAHMSRLYDDLEREYDYELRRNEAQK